MRRYLVEGLGTFVLVLGGVGTAVLARDYVGVLGVALAFGLALLVLVYVIGPISGCHVNPAVTLGLLLCRKIKPRRALGYVAAQCVGAIVAAGTVWLLSDAGPVESSAGVQGLGANGYGVHSPGGYGLGGVFLVEILLTVLLVFTALGATDVRRRSASRASRSVWSSPWCADRRQGNDDQGVRGVRPIRRRRRRRADGPSVSRRWPPSSAWS
nr:aquaporin [Candidatus Frankia alpina]